MSASDVSSVPIVTNQSHPSSKISACADPESSAAPSRARRASASNSAAPTSKRSKRAAKKESKIWVPQTRRELLKGETATATADALFTQFQNKIMDRRDPRTDYRLYTDTDRPLRNGPRAQWTHSHNNVF